MRDKKLEMNQVCTQLKYEIIESSFLLIHNCDIK